MRARGKRKKEVLVTEGQVKTKLWPLVTANIRKRHADPEKQRNRRCFRSHSPNKGDKVTLESLKVRELKEITQYRTTEFPVTDKRIRGWQSHWP